MPKSQGLNTMKIFPLHSHSVSNMDRQVPHHPHFNQKAVVRNFFQVIG